MMKWTDEMIADLQRMWGDRRSAKQCAVALSQKYGLVSRNAVIGKLHRLDMPARTQAEEAMRGRATSSESKRGPMKGRAGLEALRERNRDRHAHRMSRPALSPAPPPEPLYIPPAKVAKHPAAAYRAGRLHEIPDDACRFIAGSDHVMCGAFAADSPWCADHRKRVYAGR